jgi:hypothetical protein
VVADAMVYIEEKLQAFSGEVRYVFLYHGRSIWVINSAL